MKTATMAVALCLLCSTGAQAQVYKCTENGKTVITDRPCVGGEAMNVQPAAGHFDPKKRAAVYERIEKQGRDIDDGYRMIEEQRAREAPRPRAAAEPDERSAKERRCDELRSRKQSAEYWSKEFRHPDNINREQAKAKKGASDLWWECGKLD